MKALAALVEREDWSKALARAVELWRAARCAPLADLIDAIAARAEPLAAALQPAQRKAVEFQGAWLALCADEGRGALRVGALLDSLTSRLPRGEGDVWSVAGVARRYAAWLERVEALSAIAPDPRVARALVDVLARAPFSIGYDPPNAARIYGPALAVIGRVGDERTIALLEGLQATSKTETLRGYYAADVPAAIEAIRAACGVLDESTQRACDALLGRLAPSSEPRQSEQELLSALLRAPGDESLLGVYADVLNERGDPRGELIALQQAEERGESTAKQRKRMRALIKAHEQDWLGELTAVTRGRQYRRGLLDAASLAPSSAASDETWQTAARDERLATVRELYKGRSTDQLYERFVLSDVMRSLCTVEAPTRALLGRIGSAPLASRIERLGVRFAPKSGELDAFESLRDINLLIGAGSVGKQVRSLARRRGELARVALHFKYAEDDAVARALVIALDSWAALAPEQGPFELVVDRELVLRRGSDQRGIDVDVNTGDVALIEAIARADLPPIARLQLRWHYSASDVEPAEVAALRQLFARIGAADLDLQPDIAALLAAD